MTHHLVIDATHVIRSLSCHPEQSEGPHGRDHASATRFFSVILSNAKNPRAQRQREHSAAQLPLRRAARLCPWGASEQRA